MKKILLSLLTLATVSANAQFYPITAGRIPFGNTQRALTDDVNLEWDNTDKQILLGAGAAADPSYSFTGAGNDDNGMFRAGTDILAFATAGSSRMTISAAGLVGISASGQSSTTPASNALSVTGGISALDIISVGNTGTGTGGKIDYRNDSGTPGYRVGYGGGGGDTSFRVRDLVNSADRIILSIDGVTTLTALATEQVTVAVTADDQVIDTTGVTSIRLNSDDATPANRTITLENGAVSGQILYLHDVNNSVELADSGNVRLSAIWQPNVDDTLSLQWDATSGAWKELARSAN